MGACILDHKQIDSHHCGLFCCAVVVSDILDASKRFVSQHGDNLWSGTILQTFTCGFQTKIMVFYCRHIQESKGSSTFFLACISQGTCLEDKFVT